MLGFLRSWLALPLIATAANLPYEGYILAPNSRTLQPVAVHLVNGTVDNPTNLLDGHQSGTTFHGHSAVTYDFGRNVGGVVSLGFGHVDGNDSSIHVTFSESSLWVSGRSCDATADAGVDEPLIFHASSGSNVTASREHERGAFRYLSVVNNGSDESRVQINNLTVHFTAMPHWNDDQLRNYSGYFHSNDELLNRIWYAGAYTNQLCTIDPHHGDALVHLGELNANDTDKMTDLDTWYNNYTIANSSSVLTDGAKRDRLVWAGDMAIAVPALVVSTDDLVSVANSLDSLFAVRNKTSGQLPYAGTPFPLSYSATYHLYTLIGVADYYLYSGDIDYLSNKWSAWKQGLNFSLSFIDSSGLMNVTSAADWLRSGMGAHNIEANAILYYTINQGISLGQTMNESSSLLMDWTRKAETIKTAANTRLWSPSNNLFFDNETTALCPQDGNSWAILSNLTDPSRSALISQALSDRWTKYGAPAPEAPLPDRPGVYTISPFIGGFELQSHFLSSQPSRALELIRRQWGFMLDDPRMTNSTFIEGYSSDGSLHYAPYTNDPRISHAHGWATGPTSVLTTYLAGLKIDSAGGDSWTIQPTLGEGVTHVEAGYHVAGKWFEVAVNGDDSGRITTLTFETPAGTQGQIVLPGVSGSLRQSDGNDSVRLVSGKAQGVKGGKWELVLDADAPVTNGGSKTDRLWLLLLGGLSLAMFS